MVISDESVSGQAPTGSSLDPVSEFQENLSVPTGEVYYVESLAWDRDATNSNAPSSLQIGITSAPNGFDDIAFQQPSSVGRKGRRTSPSNKGVLALGEYASPGDTIAVTFETGTGSAPYYLLSIRRVL